MASSILYNSIYIFSTFYVVRSGYPPIGNEVLPGSVLLPATRRGRYLANIVRRQAVDGTGIRFNKDADRINAESKKKVDVLSEELLPYIIAEQERRTTLYKRVMTAIQNGEKGVTIAEIRNKPPTIIRKGLMYRCPTNRPPKEPDGSGLIMCDDDIDPSPIMYESCLSAEDKELYVAEERYFFCNRHRVEGPDLPRNGSTVIGCAPIERTSLNYTTMKCTLEDTDDVVVHYRYYPDRTYKFVTELDPDKEICDHWNPCQVGYIYSLPSPDQATESSELWHDYHLEKIVPPIPEDSFIEDTVPTENYTTSTRRIPQKEGYRYSGIGKYLPDGSKKRLSIYNNVLRDGQKQVTSPDYLTLAEVLDKKYVYITMKFSYLRSSDAGTYYARFVKDGQKGKEEFVPFITINIGHTKLNSVHIDLLPGQRVNTTTVIYTCNKCIVRGVMLRAEDGSVDNLDTSKYRVKKINDQQSYIEIDLDEVLPHNIGDYFVIVQNENGSEERIKALSVRSHDSIFQFYRLQESAAPGDPVDKTVNYTCDDCQLTDVLCHSESMLGSGRVTVIHSSKIVKLNFPEFEDSNACVYVGVFKKDNTNYTKILAVIENNSPMVKIENVPIVKPPDPMEQFEQEIRYICRGDCFIEKITVNSIPVDSQMRRSSGSFAYYLVSDNTITVRITEYRSIYQGVYQAVFIVEGTPVTKTIMEIGNKTAGALTETKESGNTSGAESIATGAPVNGNEGAGEGAGTANEGANSAAETVTQAPNTPEEGATSGAELATAG